MASQSLIRAPLFLVGAERSGTTLLRLMFDGHPQLAWNEEFEYAVDKMPAESGFPDTADYCHFLENDRVFRLSGFRIDRQLSYPGLVDSFLVQKRGGKLMVGATVHRDFDRLLRIWPDARFVHLLRDGRDVARSVVGMGWAGNVWAACDLWIEAETLWGRLSQELPANRQCTVRFEDLVSDPVRELTALAEFCGVAYDPAMLDYPKRSTYQPTDARMIQSWRHKMSAEEIRLIEARIGPMLKERGYQLSNYPPLALGPSRVWRLHWQDYWGRVRFRLRRYGLPLLLQDFVTRRAALQSLQRKVRQRLNAIDNQYLD
jgi:hypothetical protein